MPPVASARQSDIVATLLCLMGLLTACGACEPGSPPPGSQLEGRSRMAAM